MELLLPELINIIISFLPSITRRLMSKYYFIPMSKCKFKLRDHKNSLWYKDIWKPDEPYWSLIITKNYIKYISGAYFIDNYISSTLYPSILIEDIRETNKAKIYNYYICKDYLCSTNYDQNIGLKDHINNILSLAQSNGLILEFFIIKYKNDSYNLYNDFISRTY